ncbi:hypothetical protein [Mesorhizobium sp. KR1-2]|uniref:hypothetical protein n=1 Tax=Mesorhizobium sp. KR1-2 TaxID=3156609 RepID=UPI0032B3B189
MSTGFFGDIKPVRYEGPDSTNPLAYRFYNPDEIVLGKRIPLRLMPGRRSLPSFDLRPV